MTLAVKRCGKLRNSVFKKINKKRIFENFQLLQGIELEGLEEKKKKVFMTFIYFYPDPNISLTAHC